MPALSRFIVFAAVVAGYPLTQAQRPGLADLLQPGTQLLYGNGDSRPSPWTIDSVVRDVSVGGMTGCVRLRLRFSGPLPPQMRLHCVDSGMMFNWDSVALVLRRARPLGAGGQLELTQASGGRVVFTAGPHTTERVRVERGPSVDSVTVSVIPTMVTTFDASGKAIRRLRERFSIGLATATGGVFEVADSTQPGTWRVSQRFDLVAIRLP